MTGPQSDLIVAAEAYASALAAFTDQRDRLREAVVYAVTAGLSESEAARLAGVSRMTVRAWRGR